MKRVVYHVTPAGEDWRVKRVGAGRAANVYERGDRRGEGAGEEIRARAGAGAWRGWGYRG
jgi:hypothetical protein